MIEKISLSGVVGANLVVTFLYQIFTISIIGFNSKLDIFLLSSAASQFIAAVLIMPISNILLVVFSRVTKDNSYRYLRTISTIVFLVTLVISLLLYFSASMMASIVGPDYGQEDFDLLCNLLQIQSISIIFLGLSCIYSSYCRSLKLFLYTEACALLISLVILIAAFFLLSEFGSIFLAWAITLRPLGILLLLLLKPIPIFKTSSNNFDLEFLKTLWRDFYPLMGASLVFKSEGMIDRIILATSIPGTMALYNFSQQLYGAGIQLFEKVFALPISQKFANIDPLSSSGIKKEYRYEIKRVWAMLFFVFIFLLFFGKFILSLIAGYGKVSEENINELWLTMMLLFGVFAGAVLGQISMAVFYCVGLTRKIVKLNMLSFLMYIPTKIIAYYYFGVYGFACATSAHYMIDFLIQHKTISREVSLRL